MGFSLDSFFGELEEIFTMEWLTVEQKLDRLKDCIQRNEEYAIICGVIRE